MPDFPSTWPPALTGYLDRTFGPPGQLEILQGLSGAEVYRLTFAATATKVILKQGYLSRDYNFYTIVAPELRNQGIALAELYRAGYDNELYWLVLENIPLAVPRERWQADPAVLGLLQNLHRATLSPQLKFSEFYQPSWPEELHQVCLSRWSPELSSRLEPLLERWRQKYQRLFEPVGLISGDPNMLNWGTDEAGRVVLFDWERFSRGTPALDLGILVPGLLDYATFKRFAEGYLSLDKHPHSFEVEGLALEMVAAKIWSMVEFIGKYETGPTRLRENAESLLPEFAEWLLTLPAPAG